jgi:hypothetical protein
MNVARHSEKLIRIYSGTMWEAEMVRSLLQMAEIDSFLKNTMINSYAFEPISSEGVQVMIAESDQELAREIVDDYLKNK